MSTKATRRRSKRDAGAVGPPPPLAGGTPAALVGAALPAGGSSDIRAEFCLFDAVLILASDKLSN